MRSILLLVALLLTATAPGSLAQSFGGGASVHLTLTAALSGQHVEGAAVHLVAMDDGTELVERSDAGGRAVFAGVPMGLYRVDVHPIGFATETFKVLVPISGEVRQSFSLALAQELPTVSVTGERILPSLARRGFYERRTLGFGRQLTREQIMATRPTRLSDALSRIPNIRVRATTSGVAVLNLTATAADQGGACIFDVFVDGVSMLSSEGYFDGDFIPIDDVLAIEVYPRLHQTPMVYRGRGCGSILIWTGHPGQS